MTVKVESMRSRISDNPVPNQVIIHNMPIVIEGEGYVGQMFQSYTSFIAFKATHDTSGECDQIFLDENKWAYSTTTNAYRGQFLGEGIAQTRKKIKSGEYKLVDLNGK